MLEPNSTKSHDVTTGANERIQVKARVMTGPGGKFSAFRSFAFDAAVFLTFEAITLELVQARQLTSDEVTSSGARSEWTNATTLTGARIRLLGIDVTDEMRAAYARLDEITPGP